MFSCVKCGYEDNNASINILNRYTKYNEVNSFDDYKDIKHFFEDLSLNVDRWYRFYQVVEWWDWFLINWQEYNPRSYYEIIISMEKGMLIQPLNKISYFF